MRQINTASFIRFCYQFGRPTLKRGYIVSRAMSSRTYQDAVEHLNTLQSNAATLDAVRASGGRLSQFAIPEMLEYLERVGYTPDQLNALNVIHITGTKGKGSTSAFTDSIIRHTIPNWKVGLFTSPHLVAVRERIRINGVPLSEADFTKYFFEVWDRLNVNTTSTSTSLMPGYFRFITLLAFHAFLELKVDATILEVGVGGTFDSTNIVPKPVVAGVTALGIDHVNVLGKTIQEIAWQKGGIYKEDVPAFSVSQPPEGLEILEKRAEEFKASSFTVTSLLPQIADVHLGLAGAHQIQNATMAVYLSRAFLQSRSSFNHKEILPKTFIEGLKNTRWPGRCQEVIDPQRNISWYLDGAHTIESLNCCIQWFASPDVGFVKSEVFRRILVFNCTQGRSGHSFLGAIYAQLSEQLRKHSSQESANSFFEHVIFCTNITFADGHFKGDLTAVSTPPADLAELKTQQELAAAWSLIIPSFSSSKIHVLKSIEHAVRKVEEIKMSADAPVKVLVAGSLHLVGGLIEAAGLADLALY